MEEPDWKYLCQYFLLISEDRQLRDGMAFFETNNFGKQAKRELNMRAIANEHPVSVCECPMCREFEKEMRNVKS